MPAARLAKQVRHFEQGYSRAALDCFWRFACLVLAPCPLTRFSVGRRRLGKNALFSFLPNCCRQNDYFTKQSGHPYTRMKADDRVELPHDENYLEEILKQRGLRSRKVGLRNVVRLHNVWT